MYKRQGIHLFDLRYWSDALAGHVGRKDGKVVVRYDPRNLSVIWVELDGGRCIEAVSYTHLVSGAVRRDVLLRVYSAALRQDMRSSSVAGQRPEWPKEVGNGAR